MVAEGTLADILANPNSLTGQYLTGARRIEVPAERRKGNGQDRDRWRAGQQPQGRDRAIPLGTFCCITGVSGSGKSTLTIDTLQAGASRVLNGARIVAGRMTDPGLNNCDKVIEIDQSPIGRTPRSNPATYTGSFTLIRDWFAGLPEAQARGYKAGRFSFNVKGGRCEVCQGDGLIKIEMHFLPDVYVTRRVQRKALQPRDAGGEIQGSFHCRRAGHDHRGCRGVLCQCAADPRTHAYAQRGWPWLCEGGPAGHHAVRRRGAAGEAGQGAGAAFDRQDLYILDEPTTGLHFEDVRKLLEVLHRLVDQGNSVVVIEHNLDVIKTADWIIDMGPEGGVRGGTIVAEGTPEQVAKNKASFTGHYLKPLLKRG
jgi:excinuclease ABC subunit A